MSRQEGFAERSPEDLTYAGVVSTGAVFALGSMERQYGDALFAMPQVVPPSAEVTAYAEAQAAQQGQAAAPETVQNTFASVVGNVVEMPGYEDL